MFCDSFDIYKYLSILRIMNSKNPSRNFLHVVKMTKKTLYTSLKIEKLSCRPDSERTSCAQVTVLVGFPCASRMPPPASWMMFLLKTLKLIDLSNAS